MTAIERGFAARVTIILDGAAKKAARAVLIQGPDVILDSVLNDLADDLLAVYVPVYTRISKAFGDRILHAFKSHADFETKADDFFRDSMVLWIRATAAERVAMVSKTTKRMIRKAIDDGFAAEMTGPQVAKLIVEKTGGIIVRNRAVVISRTETHLASQHASVQAAKSTGLPLRKKWISAQDERTRETHNQADRRYSEAPIDLNAPFTVGSDSMQAPGLGSDPAENISCRCVVAYVTDS